MLSVTRSPSQCVLHKNVSQKIIRVCKCSLFFSNVFPFSKQLQIIGKTSNPFIAMLQFCWQDKTCTSHRKQWTDCVTMRKEKSIPSVSPNKWCSVWSYRISYKRVYVWLVIYQVPPTKARLMKSGLTDDKCLSCSKAESLKHILLECHFACQCWKQVQWRVSHMFQGIIHWRAALPGEFNSLILLHYDGLCPGLELLLYFSLETAL